MIRRCVSCAYKNLLMSNSLLNQKRMIWGMLSSRFKGKEGDKEIKHEISKKNDPVPVINEKQILDRIVTEVLPQTDALEMLLANDCMAIQREIEVANVLIGYEQANKYSIRNRKGELIGYIAEGGGIMKSVSRQLLHTKRSFSADVLDLQGNILFTVSKPMHLISSNIIISRNDTTIGEVSMDWHLYKRRYDLHIGPSESSTNFARVEGEFLAWQFDAKDNKGNILGTIDRNWMGLGKEIFADAGRYVVYMKPIDDTNEQSVEVDRFDTSVVPQSSFFSTTNIPETVKEDSQAKIAPNNSNLVVNNSESKDSASEKPKSVNEKLNWYETSSTENKNWWENLNEKTNKSEKNVSSPQESDKQVALYTAPVLSDPLYSFPIGGRTLTLDERAVFLGMAILIDFDYFSRKSGGGGFMPFLPIYVGGGSGVPTPVGSEIPTDTTSGTAQDVEQTTSSDSSEFNSRGAIDDTTQESELMNDSWSSSSSSTDDDSFSDLSGTEMPEESAEGIFGTIKSILDIFKD